MGIGSLVLVESTIDLVVFERLAYELPEDTNAEITHHVLGERTWHTLCGLSIENMRIQTGVGELDGIAYALREAATAEVFSSLDSFMKRPDLSRADIEEFFQHNYVDQKLIEEMSKDSNVRAALSRYIPEKKPDEIFKFTALSRLYLPGKRGAGEEKLIATIRSEQRGYLTGVCPECQGTTIPTGKSRRVPSRAEVEAKISAEPLRFQKEWLYEPEYKCYQCGRKWSKSNVTSAGGTVS